MSRMTKKRAKAITIEVWSYLAEYSDIETKGCLPDVLYHKINRLYSRCPLCQYFHVTAARHSCEPCPLRVENENCPSFHAWENSTRCADRAMYAKEIVDAVTAWEV